MKRLLTSVTVALALMANAQQFEVVEMQQLKVGDLQGAYHPVFSPDGKSLLITSEGYDGLGVLNLETKNYTHLTDMRGAGWLPAISNDGKTIVARQINDETLTENLYSFDVATRNANIIATGMQHFNDIALNEGIATFSVEGKMYNRAAVKDAVSAKAITPDRVKAQTYVTTEDLKIVLYKNGQRIQLDPLAGQFADWDPQYIWVHLSPDGSKILFNCHDNSYICNLDGTGLVNLGSLRGAVWRGNTHVVGMNDQHDGYFFTSSDILIVSADGLTRQQLTNSSSEIKMFPSVSPGGNQVAFHTLEGKVYLMTIKEK